MSDHAVITLIVVFFGAWGLLVAITFGDVQDRLEALERKFSELERKLTGRRVA